MNYKKKLDQFNSNPKYFEELAFMALLFTKGTHSILDYGCGTGKAVDHFCSLGYDAKGYDQIQHNPHFNYSPATTQFDLVYFMHSAAHIPGLPQVLQALITKEIIIITPNKDWIDLQKNKNYQPDPTVLSHFTLEELVSIVVSSGYGIIQCGDFGKTTDGHGERLFIKAKKN